MNGAPEAERRSEEANRILRESNAIPSWPAADCRLCREGVPVNTQYAHGADFLAAQR